MIKCRETGEPFFSQVEEKIWHFLVVNGSLFFIYAFRYLFCEFDLR